VREIRNKSSHTLVRLWRNESEKKMKYTVSKSNLNVMMGGRPRRPHRHSREGIAVKAEFYIFSTCGSLNLLLAFFSRLFKLLAYISPDFFRS
jgi:hypothetical protein